MFKLKTTKNRLLNNYVNALNWMFLLQDKALQILAILMELQLNWPEGTPIDILNKESRQYISKRMFIKRSNLSKYLRIIRDRGIVKYTVDGAKVKEEFMPVIYDNGIDVNIRVYYEDESKDK